MQLSSSTVHAPHARKGIVTALAVVAAVIGGVSLAAVTGDNGTSPAVIQRVTPPGISLPQRSPVDDRFHRFQGASPVPQGNEGTRSAAPFDDRFHRFQGASR